MFLDIGSLMFNMNYATPGGTPSWGTAMGQGNGYKFSIDDAGQFLTGMVYKKIQDIENVWCPLGKGGNKQDDYEYVLASLFDKVYFNNTLISDAKFLLLVVKQISNSQGFHIGRRTLKYTPRMKYNGVEVNNECYKKIEDQMGISSKGAWFVNEFRIVNQDELHLISYIGNKDHELVFNDVNERHDFVKKLIKENGGVFIEERQTIEDPVDIKQLIKEKYEAHADFDINNENERYSRFQSLYGKDVISALNGKELLYRLFAKKEMDENSLIYNIEHNNYYRRFGGVGGGSSFKYPLFFYSKKNTWIKGTRKNIIELTESEAISYAEELRDKLVSLFDAVEEIKPLDSIEKYQQLETIVLSDSLFTKQWVLKYLHMLYPDFFSTFYSREWIEKVATKLGIKVEGGNVSLNGQISLVANELEIPNVFFAHVIYELLDFDNNDEDEVEDKEDDVVIEDAIESKELPTRSPRTAKIHPLNSILYGAPGTGKTYATAEYAVAIIENRDIKDEDHEKLMKRYIELQKEGKIIFTTFHQSYGYEDFIQGLRPETKDGVMEFKPVDGVFKRIADKALNDNNSNYVIIIDEINRANMSKVLGELITLIEEDKRWGEVNQLSVTLPSGEVFVVPNNLYIIGTMNTADKSISIIDVALRRRFEFIEQQVDPSKVTDTKLREVLNKINSKLKDETDSTDLLVGHAYFMNKTIDDLDKLLNRAIIPLLYEYFFDNGKKVKSVVEEAISGTGYKVDSSALGRIKVVKE